MRKRMFFLLVTFVLILILWGCQSSTTPTTLPSTTSPTPATTQLITTTVINTTSSAVSSTTTASISTTTASTGVTIQSVTIIPSNLTTVWMVESFSVTQLQLRVQYSNGVIESISVTHSMISSNDLSKLSTPGRHEIRITYLSHHVDATLLFESTLLNQMLMDFYESTDYSGTYQNWLISITTSSNVFIISAQYNSQNQFVVTLSNQSVVNLGTKPLPTYIVRFLGIDGGVLSTQNVRHGQSAIEPQAPSINDYIFVGWDIFFDSIHEHTDVYAIYNLGNQFQLDVLLLSLNRLKEADFHFDMDKVFQSIEQNPMPSIQNKRLLSRLFAPRLLDETEDSYYSEANFIAHPYWTEYYYHKSLYQLPAKYNDLYVFTNTLNSYNSHTLNSIYQVTTAMTTQAKAMSEWAVDHLTVMDTWVQFPNHEYLLRYDPMQDVVELYLNMQYPETGSISYRKVRIYYNDLGEEVIELWINEYFSIGTYYGTASYYNTVGGKDFNSYTFWLDQDFKPKDDLFHFRGVNRNVNGGYDYYSNFDGMISGEYGWYTTKVLYDQNNQSTSIPSSPTFMIYTPDAHSNVLSVSGSPGFYHIQLYLPSMNGLSGLLFSENGLTHVNQDSEETIQMLMDEGLTPLPNQYLFNNSLHNAYSGILTTNGSFLHTDPLWNQQVRHVKTYIQVGKEGAKEYSNYHNYFGMMHLTINAPSLTDALTILSNYLDYLGLSYKYGETSGFLSEAVYFYENSTENTRNLVMMNQGFGYFDLPFKDDSTSFATFFEFIKGVAYFTDEMNDLLENRPHIQNNQMPPLPDRSRITLVPIDDVFTGKAIIQEGVIDASDIHFTVPRTVLLQENRQYQVVYALQVGGKIYPFAMDSMHTLQSTELSFSLQPSIPLPHPPLSGEFQIVIFLAKYTDQGMIRISSIVPLPFEPFDGFYGSMDDTSKQLSFDYLYEFIQGEVLVKSVFTDRFPPIISVNDEQHYQFNQSILTLELPYGTTISTWIESLKVWDYVDGFLPLLEANILYNDTPITSFQEVLLPGTYTLIVSDSSGNETILEFVYIDIVCTITFYDAEYNLLSSITLSYGSNIEFPTPPDRNGHTFEQWGNNATYATENYEFIAQYTVNTYFITFYIDGEIDPITLSVPYGDEIVYPDIPKVGYTLVWNTTMEIMVDEDCSVYGNYVVNRHYVYFFINYILYHSAEYMYGEEIVYPSVEPIVGYEFTGWDFLPFQTLPDEDVMIYGTMIPTEEE